MTLKGRNFLKMMDFTPEEILYLVDLSAELKEKKHQGIIHDSLVGKNIALIFEKTSTRIITTAVRIKVNLKAKIEEMDSFFIFFLFMKIPLF